MKRGLFSILLFLLLGAIVNVVVAWGLSFYRPHYHGSGDLTPEQAAVVWNRNAPEHWRLLPEPSAYCGRSLRFRYRGIVEVKSSEEIEGIAPPGGVRSTMYKVHELERGWPLPCLRAAYWERTDLPRDRVTAAPVSYQYEILNGWLFPKAESPPQGGHYIIVPYLPVYPAFLIDSILYCVFIWMMFAFVQAPRRLLSLLRRSRGHCPKCGYDLRGSQDYGCPECGWWRPYGTDE